MKINHFWSKSLAESIAVKENVLMTNIHWVIVYYFRSYYFKYSSIPSTINLLVYLNIKYNKKYDSIFLFKLFPEGVFNQVLKISCLSSFIRCF